MLSLIGKTLFWYRSCAIGSSLRKDDRNTLEPVWVQVVIVPTITSICLI